jgi:hypothetical protein
MLCALCVPLRLHPPATPFKCDSQRNTLRSIAFRHSTNCHRTTGKAYFERICTLTPIFPQRNTLRSIALRHSANYHRTTANPYFERICTLTRFRTLRVFCVFRG